MEKMKKNAISISKIAIFISIIILCTACPDNTDVPDIVGQFTWTEWKQKAGWKDYSASDYTPNAEIIDSLKQLINLDEISFILFGSNWCHRDCEPQMPRIMKLLKEIGYEQDSIVIYGLDRTKKEPANPITQYEIKFVPTLIILKNDGHWEQIIENPTPTWEEDILKKIILLN
jgi:hypothetical protein